MICQKIYPQSHLPNYLKWQILDFLRIEWPDGFENRNKYRSWITKESHHPAHFLLVADNKLLVSYVGVVWKYLNHLGEKYKMYGLSGMFTYPQFRKQGYGIRLVKAAKQYIEQSDGDICLLTTKLEGFYEKAGFKFSSRFTILEGDPRKPVKHQERVSLKFLSEKAKQKSRIFESEPIYFGKKVW